MGLLGFRESHTNSEAVVAAAAELLALGTLVPWIAHDALTRLRARHATTPMRT